MSKPSVYVGINLETRTVSLQMEDPAGSSTLTLGSRSLRALIELLEAAYTSIEAVGTKETAHG